MANDEEPVLRRPMDGVHKRPERILSLLARCGAERWKAPFVETEQHISGDSVDESIFLGVLSEGSGLLRYRGHLDFQVGIAPSGRPSLKSISAQPPE